MQCYAYACERRLEAVMFRELRRKNQQLSETEARSILKNGTYGVLSVQGDDGYPYGVPMNYVYGDDAIYFHCAKEGHKLEGFQRSDKVSFCVVGEDEVIPESIFDCLCQCDCIWQSFGCDG